MVHLLLLGDSHIPKRATEVPIDIYSKIKDISEGNLFDYTFFTGDLINAPKLMEFLKKLTNNEVFRVIGNMDYYGGDRDLPLFRDLHISLNRDDNLSLGLIHGHNIHPRGDHNQLESFALDNNYNILASGHTHKEEVYLTKNGILLLNPGSITGAWSFNASQNYSFIILKINEQSKDISVNLFQKSRNSTKFSTRNFYFLYVNESIRNKY
jgi:putative phosphoesterase